MIFRFKNQNLKFQYFDRQQEELNAGWENLQTEMARFKQEKQDEWQKIAALRSSLQSDRAKVGAKKDAERIKELELEVGNVKKGGFFNAY
jgi:predicted  nucleic acid-binding Zn-ribbon protein